MKTYPVALGTGFTPSVAGRAHCLQRQGLLTLTKCMKCWHILLRVLWQHLCLHSQVVFSFLLSLLIYSLPIHVCDLFKIWLKSAQCEGTQCNLVHWKGLQVNALSFSCLLISKLIMICLDVVFFMFFMLGSQEASCDCGFIIFLKFGKNLAIISSNIHSVSLCLLFGSFNPFTFKVIINMYVPITIFFIVLGLFL